MRAYVSLVGDHTVSAERYADNQVMLFIQRSQNVNEYFAVLADEKTLLSIAAQIPEAINKLEQQETEKKALEVG